jgi:RNase H-like domain found in reverse transcriptase
MENSTIMDPHTDDVMLSFQDFNRPFLEIHVDASDVQLGSVTMQDCKPVELYIRKLNPAQQSYI